MELAATIDHTLLSPSGTSADIQKLCEEASEHGFATVCVLPYRVAEAALALRDTGVGVCTVVGFPLGGTFPSVKAAEAALAVEAGATEIDMVINIGAVLDGQWDVVSEDIREVQSACAPAPLKVILETGLLTDEQKRLAARLCKELQVAFVKTSTGSAHGGATVEDVALLRAEVGPDIGVKASGGIKTLEQAKAMIAAGATRLGTSHGVSLLAGNPASSFAY